MPAVVRSLQAQDSTSFKEEQKTRQVFDDIEQDLRALLDELKLSFDLVAISVGKANESLSTIRARTRELADKADTSNMAAQELRTFVQRFPTHDLADNAQYWLGESYYARAAYRDAIPEFRAVVRRWPSGNKVPDALLKLGFCHLALGERAEGQATLDEVAQHYPRTEAAQLATRRLGEIGSESNAKVEKNP